MLHQEGASCPPINYFTCKFKDKALETMYRSWANENLGIRDNQRVFPEDFNFHHAPVKVDPALASSSNECSSRYLTAGFGARQEEIGVGQKRWKSANLTSLCLLLITNTVRTVFFYFLSVNNTSTSTTSLSDASTFDASLHNQALTLTMY